MIRSLTLEFGTALNLVFMFVVQGVESYGVLWDYKQGNYHCWTGFLCKYL